MLRRSSMFGPAVLAALLAALAFHAPQLPGAASESAPRKVVSVEGITEYKLPNSVRILLFPDPSASKVTVNMTVLSGSRQEGYGETGMAHLLEHMLFKGTPTHRDIPKALRDRGAQFNASTNYDYTNYFESLRATDDNLEFAIRLEADRLVNSLVRHEDLVTEMTVVRNEFENFENSPQAILFQRMMEAAYAWHNYGKLTIGNRSDIERVPIERLQAFYRKHYQPDNIVVTVAGKFDEAKALQYLVKYFGSLKKPARILDTTYTEEPAQDGERNVILRRVGTVAEVGATYHIPAGPHEDFAALDVLATMVSSEPSGQLYQELVAGKKASNVSCSANSQHDPGVLVVLAEVNKGISPEDVRDAMLNILEKKLQEDKLDPAAVERAKRKLAKDYELLLTDSSQVGLALSDWAALGDWRLFFLHRDRVAKVTPDDVIRVARRYLQRNNRTVGLYLPSEKPQRTAIPATPEVAELVKGYKGGSAVATGEAFDPTPANIEKRVERTELPDGVKVAMLLKKTRGEKVTAELKLRYGNLDSLKGRNTIASQLLASLMMRGTQRHSRQEIEDLLDQHKINLTPNSDTGELTFTIECKKGSWPTALAILQEILREPAFPLKEFEILKRETRNQYDSNRKDPMALGQQELQRKLFPYPKDDPRYTPTVDELVERSDAVTLEDVRNLYTEQLGGQAGEFAVVGDFDPAETRKLINTALQDWKNKVPYRRIEQPAIPRTGGEQVTIPTPDKANALYMAGLIFSINDADPDNTALRVGNFLLGGNGLSGRLANRIRQKEGLSYTVASQYQHDTLDKRSNFIVYAICNPANITKVNASALDELNKLVRDGIPDKELADAKKGYLEQIRVQCTNDNTLRNMLQSGLHIGRTFNYYTELEKKVEALTPANVESAIRKYIDPKKLVIIEAGDLKK